MDSETGRYIRAMMANQAMMLAAIAGIVRHNCPAPMNAVTIAQLIEGARETLDMAEKINEEDTDACASVQ